MELPLDPIERFAALYEQAKQTIPVDPNAMIVATVGDDGRPSTRVVLLKDFDARGFVFYTNYESRKGRELLAPPVTLRSCFYWQPLERQVRIEGRVEPRLRARRTRTSQSRARGSQIGAWASLQSQPLPSRAAAGGAGGRHSPASTRARRCPARRTGRASGSSRSASSSGTRAPAACTSASSTCARATAGSTEFLYP